MNKIVYSFDIEDYFMASCFDNQISRNKWNQIPSKIELGLDRIIEILDLYNIKATFFFLGYVAEKYPELLKKVHVKGHEIACHGYNHNLVNNFDFKQFDQDIKRATSIIENITGEKVLGYRAPTFSLDIEDSSLIDILINNGYRYDSSNFPFHWNQKNKRINFSQDLFKIRDNFYEVPMTSINFSRFNFPLGGGYSRLYPTFFNKLLISKQINLSNIILYFHPWEFLNSHPISPKKLPRALRHKINIGDNLFNKLNSIMNMGLLSSRIIDLID
jgi:polysaccharide deacetylase family protein (PEP-CTERM system associated)